MLDSRLLPSEMVPAPDISETFTIFTLIFLLLFPFYGEWTEYLVAFTDRQESADQGQRASDWLFIMGLPM